MNIAIPLSTSKTQFYINMTYIEYVTQSGMSPILVTPQNNIEEVVKHCDGLLLPGGIDIDPIYYGVDNYNSQQVDPDKDAFERGLFHIFRENGKPIFGICRGMQLIACEFIATKVAEGIHMEDTLHFCQHIDSHNQVGDQGLKRDSFQHFVNYIPEKLYAEKGKEVFRMPVNSMHHQCLVVAPKMMHTLKPGGFNITAWTGRGGGKSHYGKEGMVVEGFNITGWGGPIAAVQWHPEELLDIQLLTTFFSKNKAFHVA